MKTLSQFYFASFRFSFFLILSGVLLSILLSICFVLHYHPVLFSLVVAMIFTYSINHGHAGVLICTGPS